MKSKRELWGLQFELAGLIILFIATTWQLSFTDWWDIQLREWEGYIQEDVNLAVLLSLKDLASLTVEENKANKQYISDRIIKTATKAYDSLIQKREERRKAINEGQVKFFGNVRVSLLLLGAGLMIAGKWLVLSDARSSLI